MTNHAAGARAVAGIAAVAALSGCGGADHATAQTTPGTSPAVVEPWASTTSSDLAAPSRNTVAGLTYRADGTALATWDIATKTATKEGWPATRTGIAKVDASAHGTSPVVLDRWRIDAPKVRADGRIDLLLARRKATTEVSQLATQVVDESGAVGAEQQLTKATLSDAAFDVAPNGAAVVAWAELRPAKSLGDYGEGWDVVVRIALRKAGAAAFAAPRTLQHGLGIGSSISTSIADDGRFVVADDEHGYAKQRWGIRGWTGSVTTGKVSPSVRVGPSETSTTLRTAMLSTGRAVIAWGTMSHGEEPHSPWEIRAATLDAGGRKVGSTQAVDVDGDETWTPDVIAMTAGPDDRVTLAWSHIGKRKADEPEVRVASSDAGDRFGQAQQLPFSQIGGLSVRADGTTVLTVGGSPDRTNGRTYALVRRPAEAAFGTPELLGTPLKVLQFDGLNELSGVPVPSVDPASGRPAIAWTEQRGTGATLVTQRRSQP